MKKYYVGCTVFIIAYICAVFIFGLVPKEHEVTMAAPPNVSELEIYQVEAKLPEIFPRVICPLDDDTQQMIVNKCEYYNIDFAFTMAIIYCESSFNPNADSGSSVGLMQINRINHEWLSEEVGFTDFFDPEQNVTAGLYILRDLFEKYDDPTFVLMCYNMGEYKAKQMWDEGVYSTAYSRAVLAQAEIYRAQIEEYIN